MTKAPGDTCIRLARKAGHLNGMLFVDLTLARRLEMITARSGRDCANSVRNAPSASVEIAGGIASFTGADSPITQAFGVGLGGPVSESELDELEDFFVSRGAPVTLELCPFIDGSLVDLLKQRPYRLEEFSNVLVRELSAGETFERSRPGITVRPALTHEASLFTSIVMEGFAEQVPMSEALRIVLESFFHRTGSRCLLASADGELAGGAYVAADQSLAELYGAATRPGFRGRGVQTVLIADRLAWALEQGCDMATTTTQPGSISQRNFERAGFRVVYSRTKLVRRP